MIPRHMESTKRLIWSIPPRNSRIFDINHLDTLIVQGKD